MNEYIQPLSQSAWAAVTNDHRLSGLNGKLVFLTVLEAEVQGAGRSGIW